jgi:hypothetical protein
MQPLRLLIDEENAASCSLDAAAIERLYSRSTSRRTPWNVTSSLTRLVHSLSASLSEEPRSIRLLTSLKRLPMPAAISIPVAMAFGFRWGLELTMKVSDFEGK